MAGLKADWRRHAACSSADPDTSFVHTEQAAAKKICTGCKVRTECLAVALDNRIKFGVWGGLTVRERQALLREDPTISSWWEALSSTGTPEEQRRAG